MTLSRFYFNEMWKKERAAASQVHYYVIMEDVRENTGAWVSCT